MAILQKKPNVLKSLFSSGLKIIDVRGLDEYEDRHVPNSILIPLPVFDANKVAEQGFKKTDTVYIICRSGVRSMAAANKLVDAGFTDVVNIEGGIILWEQSGLPVER